MKRKLAVFAGLLGIVAGIAVARTVYRGPLVYESALAYNKNYTLNVANYGIDQLAATAVYSSATVNTQTFTGGTVSTGSFTVNTVTDLLGKRGTNSLVVLSTNGLTTASITIAGSSLYQGTQWWTQTSTNSVATSIKTAINNLGGFVATTTGNTVNISCASSGTWCNTVPLAVVGTTSITATAATFSGGIDKTQLSVNNVQLTAGTDWAVGASTAATANNIATAINANTSLNTIVTSTAPVACGLTNPCGIVKVTALNTGTNAYALYSSSNSQVTVSVPITTDSYGRGYANMTGGTTSAWTINSPTITIAGNPFWARDSANGQASMVGLPVLLSTAAVPQIGGLTLGTTYFVIPVDYNSFKLSATSTGAIAGLAITITSTQTPTTANTYTLRPLAISGTPSFKWQVSNDGTSWQDFTTTSSGVAVSSVTILSYTAGGASTSWDFGNFGYSYLRLAVIGPTTGGLNLYVGMNGKTNSDR